MLFGTEFHLDFLLLAILIRVLLLIDTEELREEHFFELIKGHAPMGLSDWLLRYSSTRGGCLRHLLYSALEQIELFEELFDIFL
jgi:hypothetical protein